MLFHTPKRTPPSLILICSVIPFLHRNKPHQPAHHHYQHDRVRPRSRAALFHVYTLSLSRHSYVFRSAPSPAGYIPSHSLTFSICPFCVCSTLTAPFNVCVCTVFSIRSGDSINTVTQAVFIDVVPQRTLHTCWNSSAIHSLLQYHSWSLKLSLDFSTNTQPSLANSSVRISYRVESSLLSKPHIILIRVLCSPL